MIVENTIIYNTVVVYPLKNNTGKNFSVPFPVDSEMSSLLVYIDEQQTETGWTFDSESSVITFTEVPTGESLIIRRKTKTDALIVTFNPGSILSDREQNRNSKQMICAIQEIEDLYALYKDELIGYNTLFKEYYDSVTAAEQVVRQQAQAAVNAKVAAESAQAAAEAAVGTLDNSLIPAHNSSPSAHPAIQNKFSSYLPLAGGTMTGSIKRKGVAIQNPASGEHIELIGDSNGENGKGGALFLFDKANSTYPGWFILRAGAENTYSDLRGNATGKLTWMGHDVLRDYFARADNTGMIQLLSGTDYLNGAYLRMGGLENTSSFGDFKLGAGNGTTAHELRGTPDGQLTWDNVTVLNEEYIAIPNWSAAVTASPNTTYTAASDGWLYIDVACGSEVDQTGTVAIDGTDVLSFRVQSAYHGYGHGGPGMIPVRSGQTYAFSLSATDGLANFSKFYPAVK